MRGASVLKANDDKTQVLGKNSLMAISGESGDTSMSNPLVSSHSLPTISSIYITLVCANTSLV